jgi:hypothetical protein
MPSSVDQAQKHIGTELDNHRFYCSQDPVACRYILQELILVTREECR